MLKVVSSNGVNAIVEGTFYFYCIPPSYSGKISRISKKEQPLWRIAAEAKWGYIPLKEPVPVKSPQSITDEMLEQLSKQRQWERDCLS